MEARLALGASARPVSSAGMSVMTPAVATSPVPAVGATVLAVSPSPSTPESEAVPLEEGAGGSWPDDSAESAFLAEARSRGEVLAPAKAREEIAEETDGKALPPLNELVNRIPSEVRDALEDLFRARFVTVKRVPKRALKA